MRGFEGKPYEQCMWSLGLGKRRLKRDLIAGHKFLMRGGGGPDPDLSSVMIGDRT